MDHLEPVRTFVTGGAGFIGGEVAASLLRDGALVTVFDNLSTAEPDWASRFDRDPRLTFVRGDITHKDALRDVMAGHGRVVHLASGTDIAGGFGHPQRDFDSGVVGTERVCESMRAVGIDEIWFASSGVVYGRPARIPTGEGDGPLLPESHYAAAKLAGEALISGFASLYGWRAHAFRFGNTVGPRSNHGVVHDFVVKLLRDPTRLEILGDGTQAKPYIAVDDLVAGIRRGVSAAARAPMTILNVGTEGTLTVRRVAAIVVEALGLAPDSVELAFAGSVGTGSGAGGGWPGDTALVEFDTSALRALGWEPRLSAADAVATAAQGIAGRYRASGKPLLTRSERPHRSGNGAAGSRVTLRLRTGAPSAATSAEERAPGGRLAPAALVTPAGLVVLVTIVVAIWAAAFLVNRVDRLSAPPYDLAFFQQVVWNVADRGQWISTFHQGSFLGLHFSPVLVVPALAERLVGPDVRVLNLFHALAVAAFVPAAFLFLRALLRPSRFGPVLAAALAIGIPVWGTMQGVIRSDFHPETAGVCLALLAGWAGLTRRHRAMWALALVALATREDVSYAVAVIGLAVAVRGRGPTRRQGLLLVLVAAAWAIAVFGLLMPAIRAGARTDTDRYYAWLGGGLAALLAPFDHTSAVIFRLTRATPWLALAGMVVALLGLPLVRPRWLALALPPMAAVLLSANDFQANLRLQYPLILVLPLLVAAGFGARRVLAIAEIRWRRRRRQRTRARRGDGAPARRTGPALVLLLAIPAVVGAWIQGSLPPFDRVVIGRPAGLDQLKAAAAVVPPEAVLAADEGLMAPLAARSEIRRLIGASDPPAGAFLIMDRLAWTPTPRTGIRHDEILASLLAGDRPVLVDDGEFIVWGPEPGGVLP